MDGKDSSKIWKSRAFKAWAIIGCGLIFAGVVYACSLISQAIAVIAFTGIIVFLFHGLVDKIESRGLPRWLGALASELIIVLVAVLVLMAVVPAAVEQVSNLVQNSGWYADRFREFLENHAYLLGSASEDGSAAAVASSVMDFLMSQLTDMSGDMVGGMVSGALGVGEVLLVAFVSMLCSYWILIDLPVMGEEVRGLVPDGASRGFELVMDTLETVVYGWAKATLICAVLTGLACGVGCAIVGVPYAVLMGVVSGAAYLIPYVGVAVAVVVVLIAGVFASPITALMGGMVVLIVHNVVANVASPKLMGNAVNVHPALILIVIIAGGNLGGAVGMLLAIPIAATVQSLAVAYYEHRTKTKLSSPDGALFSDGTSGGQDEAADEPKGSGDSTAG